MPTFLLRFTTGGDITALEEAVHTAFVAVESQRPEGIKQWTYLQGPGEAEFVAVLELEDGAANPLLNIDAAQQLQTIVAGTATGDVPAPRPVRLLGSYVSTRGSGGSA